MRLTFVKDFTCIGGAGRNIADLAPYTITGEAIDDVVSCKVESGVEMLPVMTLTVRVREHLSDDMAARLRGKNL